MGKLNFSNFGLQGVEPLSRDEMKGVVGGNMPPDLGQCISCTTASGMSSCWYTNDEPASLCERVYPGESGDYEGVPDCNGCTMN